MTGGGGHREESGWTSAGRSGSPTIRPTCRRPLGALFGTVKLLYAAVSVRTREITTLRAIGYQPLPVALSVVLEATALALTGALIGAAVAWLLFDGKLTAQARMGLGTGRSGGRSTWHPRCARFGTRGARDIAIRFRKRPYGCEVTPGANRNRTWRARTGGDTFHCIQPACRAMCLGSCPRFSRYSAGLWPAICSMRVRHMDRL